MASKEAFNSYKGNNNFQPPCANTEEWIAWLKLNPRDLRRLPAEFYSEKLFLSIVKHNGFAIGGVPFNHLTPQLLITAIKRDPMALGNIPESMRSRNLCQISLEGDLKAIRLVPDKLLMEFAEKVLKIDGQHCRSIINKIDSRMLEIAVQTTPNAIQYIPPEQITLSMAIKALEKDGEVLQYIPINLLSKELILLALSTDRFGFVFASIPDEFKDNFKNHEKIILL